MILIMMMLSRRMILTIKMMLNKRMILTTKMMLNRRMIQRYLGKGNRLAGKGRNAGFGIDASLSI